MRRGCTPGCGPGGALFILFMQTGRADGPPFDCKLDAMQALFAAGWSWPDTLPDAGAA
ncbi:MAG: hypothetical protein WDN49_25190 [Acetobacteraceae bacterium]